MTEKILKTIPKRKIIELSYAWSLMQYDPKQKKGARHFAKAPP